MFHAIHSLSSIIRTSPLTLPSTTLATIDSSGQKTYLLIVFIHLSSIYIALIQLCGLYHIIYFMEHLSRLMIVVVLLALLEIVADCQERNNLLRNPNFSANVVPNSTYTYFTQIDGWNCRDFCQLDECHVYSIEANCTGNYLDLDGKKKFEAITQVIVVNADKCLLEGYFYYPYATEINKTLLVYFNSRLVYSHTTNLTWWKQRGHKTFSLEIESLRGENNLTITMNGSAANSYGFLLKNIYLVEIRNENIRTTVIDAIYQNRVTESFMGIPGYRIIFSNFLTIFANIDRFQLYIFHQRNYSDNALIFIQKINQIKENEDELILDIMSYFGLDVTKIIAKLKKSMVLNSNYQKNTSEIIKSRMSRISDNYEDGFILNEIYFLIFKVPFMMLMFIGLAFMNYATRNSKFYSVFEKYELWGIFLLMVFQGNIEELTFYLTGQLHLLFMLSPYRALFNTSLLGLLFIIIIFSFGGFILLRWHYRQKVKLFLDHHKSDVKGILAATIDRGIFCGLLGVVHRLFLESGSLQIMVLIFVQLVWIILRGYNLRKKSYKVKAIVVVWILQGLNRIIFQITLYIYQKNQSLRSSINEVQYYVILTYSILILLEIIFNLVPILQEIKNILQSFYNRRLITPIDSTTPIDSSTPIDSNTLKQQIKPSTQKQISKNNRKILGKQVNFTSNTIKVKDKKQTQNVNDNDLNDFLQQTNNSEITLNHKNKQIVIKKCRQRPNVLKYVEIHNMSPAMMIRPSMIE